MDLKRFENTAHQSYWSVHIEAWRQSGVSRTRYCRDHGLNRHTFGSWVIYLMGRDEARKHEEYQADLRREQSRRNLEKGRSSKRQCVRFEARTDTRSRAVQAFWAMHLEALNWSGMSLSPVRVALNLSGMPCKNGARGMKMANWKSTGGHSFIPLPVRALEIVLSTNVAETALTARVAETARGAASSATNRSSRSHVKATSRAPVCPPPPGSNGIVTGLLFRWRVEFEDRPERPRGDWNRTVPEGGRCRWIYETARRNDGHGA